MLLWFFPGYHNGVLIHNGIDYKPSKLRELEVERLDLGWYRFAWKGVISLYTRVLFFNAIKRAVHLFFGR